MLFNCIFQWSDLHCLLFLFPEHDDRTMPQFRNRKGKGMGRPFDRSRRDRQRGGHSGNTGGLGSRLRLGDTDGDVVMSDNSQESSSQHRL